MIKKILVMMLLVQSFVLADFKGVDATTLEAMMKKGAPVIDIRTSQEWKQDGIIKGAHKIMFFDDRGQYDIDKFLNQLSKVVKDKNQPFVLVCRSASRTNMLGKFLANEVGYTKVRELAGGMVFGWQKLKKPVLKQ